MSSEEIHVPGWPAPRGYANGRAGEGRVIHVAGQIGWDEHGAFVAPELVPQFARALDNVLAVVRAAGGAPEDIAAMTVYVTDIAAYRGAHKQLGAAWRDRLGKHFPAMALVAVRDLVEPQAVVEIQATAYVGGGAMIAPATFAFALARGVATITLDRPDRLNALTFEVYRELAEAFEQLDREDDVRAVVITGRGRGFCSGGDQDDIIKHLLGRDTPALLAFTRATGRLIEAIRSCRRPVIAAINGTAVGAGAVIACACDLRIAAAGAKLGFIFPQVGLCGADMGVTYLLPRIVGLGHATELLMFGDIIPASRALEIGLVNRVTPDGAAALAMAQDWAARLARGPAFAHAMTKQMIESEHTMALAEAIEAEAQAQALCMQHPDFGEAHEAFKAKRPARFRGAPPDGDGGDNDGGGDAGAGAKG